MTDLKNVARKLAACEPLSPEESRAVSTILLTGEVVTTGLDAARSFGSDVTLSAYSDSLDKVESIVFVLIRPSSERLELMRSAFESDE